MRKSTLLFDLDGTLTDPKTGIVRCIQHALTVGQYVVPNEDELLWCIGPPLQKVFATLVPGANEAEVWRLVSLYRERFSATGFYENRVYPGMEEVLGSLAKDHTLFVATSKPHVFAQKILDHFGLRRFFRHIYGAELDGVRSDKGALIAYLLACEHISPAECFMIGDREYDILGARQCGVDGIGVLWGYGSRRELECAGAVALVESPQNLRDISGR